MEERKVEKIKNLEIKIKGQLDVNILYYNNIYMRNKTTKKYNKKTKIGGGNFLSDDIKESINSFRDHLNSNVKVSTGTRSSPGKQNVPDLIGNVATASPAVTLPRRYLTRKERKDKRNKRSIGGGNTISGSIQEGSPPDIENQKKKTLFKSKFFTTSPFTNFSSSDSSSGSFRSLDTSESKDNQDKEVASIMDTMSLGASNAFRSIREHLKPAVEFKSQETELNKTKKSIDNFTDQVQKLQTDLSKIDEEEFEERKKGGLTFGGKRRKSRRKLRKRRRTRKRGGDKLYISTGDTAKRPAKQVESSRSPTIQQQKKQAIIAKNKITGPVTKATMGTHIDSTSGFSQDETNDYIGGKRRRTRKNRRLGGTTPPPKKQNPPTISPNQDRVAVAAPQYQPGHQGPQNLMGAFNAVA